MAGSSKIAPRPRSLRSQKKQSRLQFSPLPTSSPNKDSYSQSIRNRLANVRYAGGRHWQQKVITDSSDEAAGLPTPQPSSQIRHNSEEPVFKPGKILSPSSSLPSKTNIHPIDLSSSGSDVDSDDDEEPILSSSKRRKLSTHRSPFDVSSTTPTRKSTRIRDGISTTKQNYTSTNNDSEHSSRRNMISRNKLSDLGSAETSGDEDNIVASSPAKRRKSAQNNDHFMVDDDDSVIESRPSKRANSKKNTLRSRLVNEDNFVVGNDEIEYITSDDDVAVQAVKTSQSPKQFKSEKYGKLSRRRSEREQQEIKEDLKDLQDSESENITRKSRTRGGPVTTQRDKAKEHLALLKRRRAGEKIPRVEDSDEADDDDNIEETHLDLIGQPDYQTDEGSIHSSLSTGFEPEDDNDNTEDDFVIDDSTTGRLGRPHPDMPLQFTSFASAKPRELFPHVVEWLVKNKLAPAFARDDELYNLAFDRVDDQVKAQAGSRLISSAWTATFKYTILARPNIEITTLSGLDEDNIRTCDACNKTNRPARYDFVLTGSAYSERTLEPIDNSQDEDDLDDADDDASRDEDGHVLASQRHHFYLGSHCAANAQMGHKLTHWKYHLNEAVLSYLEEQGVLSPEAIVARDKMKHRKRGKEAEAIIDSMQEIGKISELWKDFQNDLEDARLGMEDYEKSSGRSRGRIGTIKSTTTDGLVREWNNEKYKETRRVESDSEAE